MDSDKRPVKISELEHTGEMPDNISDLADQITGALNRSKGELLGDEKFMGEMLMQAIKHPMAAREAKAGVANKERRYAIVGRTEKKKLWLLLSQTESQQLDTYRAERGDRTVSDLINEMVVRALAALRAL